MVIKDYIQPEGKLLAEIISLPASFEREVVGVLSLFPWGLKVDAAYSKDSIGLDCPYMNLHGLDVLS